jgi:biotin transporter BioY
LHHLAGFGVGNALPKSTGIAWVALYVSMDSEAKWGQVVGNIVSEWTQIIGLVLLTKRLIERRSKESAR